MWLRSVWATSRGFSTHGSLSNLHNTAKRVSFSVGKLKSVDVFGKRKELIVDACLVCGCCWNDRFGQSLVVISVPFVTDLLV